MHSGIIAVHVTVNGQLMQVADNTTLAGLIRSHDLEAQRVAVEINRDLVPRTRFEHTRLHPGDHIEIVTFVGGG